MLTSPQFYRDNIAAIKNRIAAAALSAGRQPESVTLIAVSKLQPSSAIAAAYAAGLVDFGENYVQEALLKQPELQINQLAWHFIGQLQTNKTRVVAGAFDWVHTVDRLKLAQRLSEQRSPDLKPLNICLQVALETEPGKGGVAPEALGELALAVAELPHLRLRGLMCIPPETTDEALARARFARLRGLLEKLNGLGLSLDALSMGMSGDFEAAIKEGATHVRVGTAIFGARPPAASI